VYAFSTSFGNTLGPYLYTSLVCHAPGKNCANVHFRVSFPIVKYVHVSMAFLKARFPEFMAKPGDEFFSSSPSADVSCTSTTIEDTGLMLGNIVCIVRITGTAAGA
jgi:hypothetical protein